MLIIENFLQDKIIDEVLKDIESYPSTTSIPSSKIQYPEILQGIDSDFSIIECSNQKIRAAVKDNICKVFPKYKFTYISTQYHVYDLHSGLSLHTDAGYVYAATLYLNKEWSYNYGGILVFEDSDGWKAYCPKFNDLVINTEQRQHLVTPITSARTETRKILQIFGRKADF